MLYLYGESALGWNTTQCVRVLCTRVLLCACVRARSAVVCRDFLPSHLLTPQMRQTGNDFDSYSAGVCVKRGCWWAAVSFSYVKMKLCARVEMQRVITIFFFVVVIFHESETVAFVCLSLVCIVAEFLGICKLCCHAGGHYLLFTLLGESR